MQNLAMRAADAAKNTVNLIEATVKKVKDGPQLVNKTNEAFSEVARSAAKVGELVAEIAAASNEQAQGIDQINKAVAEMDKVVQQNAANAEESAAASEELNAQAEQMKSYVQDLVGVVGGSGRNGAGGGFLSRAKRKKDRQNVESLPELRRPTTSAKFAGSKVNGKIPATHRTGGTRPDQVIPFEEELKDF